MSLPTTAPKGHNFWLRKYSRCEPQIPKIMQARNPTGRTGNVLGSLQLRELGVAYRGTCRLDSDQERYEEPSVALPFGGKGSHRSEALQVMDEQYFPSSRLHL